MRLKHTTLATIAFALLLCWLPVRAQENQPTTPPQPPAKSSLFGRATALFNKPLHPVIKGVASTGGLGGGLQYEFPHEGRWETTTTALVTLRRYWSLQFDSAYRSERFQAEGYARMRHMTQLNYFGPGMESVLEDRTSFLMRDPVVGAVSSVRLGSWLSVGGRVEEIWPEIGSGRSPTYPTLESRFSAADAPGLLEQPSFGRYQGFVELWAPDSVGQAFNQGGRYRISYGLYDDQQLDRYTFTRLEVEGQHKFAVFGPHRRLTLHGWIATTDTDAGNEVPFYFMPTLGGTGQLHTINEQLIGTDRSLATLRGFDNFRFRDRHLMLLQAEYRIPLWGPLDGSVFVDAGKVVRNRADLNLLNLKRDYGFSLSVMKGPVAVLRADVGWGGEGVNVFLSFGKGGDVAR
jgi:hypothetical protein